MSNTVYLYITDESVFPATLAGTDAEKYQWLVKKVTTQCSRWETLELNEVGYINALEAIGELVGSKKFFAVLSYNNSPNNCLGNAPSIDGSFGYFNPKMVKDGLSVLQDIENDVANFSNRCESIVAASSSLNRDTLEYVFYRYLSAFQEAAAHEYAVTVIHE